VSAGVVWFANSGYNPEFRLTAILVVVSLLSIGMARLTWVLSGVPFYSDATAPETIPRAGAAVFTGGAVVACSFLPVQVSAVFMIAAFIVPLAICWVVAAFRNRLHKLGYQLFIQFLTLPLWILLCWVIGGVLPSIERAMNPNHPSDIAAWACVLLLLSLALAEGQRRLVRTGFRTWRDYAVLMVVLLPVELVLVAYLMALLASMMS
jgi:hypothetical protein